MRGLARTFTGMAFVAGLAMSSASVGVAEISTALGPCFPPGQAAAVEGPSPRDGMGLAYDAARHEVVLFGGRAGNSYFADTWMWDGGTWIERHPAAAPSPRASFGMVYDQARHEIVLFGGYDGHESLGGTWTWDGVTWTERHPADSPPDASDSGMAFDNGSGRIVKFGGSGGAYFTSWLWDGTDWESIYDPTGVGWRDSPGMSRSGNHVLMFGGDREGFESDFRPTRTTFAWDGSAWSGRQPKIRPSARNGAGMAYDEARDEVVLFGGANATRELGDTWVWDGGAWIRRGPLDVLRPRTRVGMAYDGARHQTVLFGGSKNGGDCFFGDTWTWDGVTWTEH
jgi:hypothetical protein